MLYLRIDENNKITYPFDIRQLSVIYPGTLWRENPTPQQLASVNVHSVKHVDPPAITKLQNLRESQPRLEEGGYVKAWSVQDKTVEEMRHHKEAVKREKYEVVERALRDSDWTQLADTPPNIKAAWADYRVQLRAQLEVADPDLIEIPAKPELTQRGR